MRKSIQLLLVVVVVMFSGTVFSQDCKGVSGEIFFDVEQITVPEGLLVTVAKGFSDEGKIAMLSFQFPDRAQLLVGTGNQMEVVEDYGVEDVFKPTIMTKSGAIVGDAYGNNQLPAVMFINGDDYSLYELTEYGGWIISAVSDSNGNVYVLVNENNDLQLFIVSGEEGIVSKTEVAEMSPYYYYGDGGIYIDEKKVVIYLVAPTSFSFSSLYFQFLSIFELDLDGFAEKDYYILGWDGSYLPYVDFGGIEGANLVGRYDDQPFAYNLVSQELKIYSICDDEYAIARGVVFGDDWLVGEIGSASLFFQNLRGTEKIILDFQFDYFSVWNVSQDNIVVQTDNQFYIISLKNYAKH